MALRFVVVGLANTMIGLAIVYSSSGREGRAILPRTSAAIPWASPRAMCSTAAGRSATPAHVPRIARFCMVFATVYAANLGTILVPIDQLGINGYTAQAFGVPPYTALFYLGSRYVAFPEGGSCVEIGLWGGCTERLGRSSPTYPAEFCRRVTIEVRMSLDTEHRRSATTNHTF